MKRSALLSLLASTSIALMTLGAGSVDEFVYPKSPLQKRKGRTPSPKVTDGTVFESGELTLKKGQTLVLPADAVVEQHDGPEVRLFLTKSQRCVGHPPAPMRFAQTRSYYGVAQSLEKGSVVVSTFGEWSNRGGSARIRLFAMVPKNMTYKLEKGLSGKAAKASTRMNFGDKALETAYWYAGTKPSDGWKEIPTRLHSSKFLAPQ